MKNITIKSFLIVFVTLISLPVLAQPAITLEAFGGWLWTGKAGYNNNIKVDDKGNYGLRGGISPSDEMVVEFEWNHTDTRLHGYDVLTQEYYEVDVAMNYYLLGFNMQKSEGPAIPYGLFNIGVLNVQGQQISFSENWFTVGLGGGLKYYISDRIGIRLQARLLLPMQFAGIGFGCGGGGCSSGVSTYTNTIQGDFTGGIILKLGS